MFSLQAFTKVAKVIHKNFVPQSSVSESFCFVLFCFFFAGDDSTIIYWAYQFELLCLNWDFRGTTEDEKEILGKMSYGELEEGGAFH